MKIISLFWLLLLPVCCHAQFTFLNNLLKKTNKNESTQQSDDKFTYSQNERINTAVLFPQPPEINDFKVSSTDAITFTIKACVTNLKSSDDLRVTLNGEEQSIRQQTSLLTVDKTCPNGYIVSYTLTRTTSQITVSLEARNEGGATIQYLNVPVKK